MTDLETGTRALVAGDLRNAVIALRRAVPSHAVHHNLAVALRARGEIREALRHAHAAIAIESCAPTLALLASLQNLDGDHAGALATLREARATDPLHDVTRYYLGIALAIAGDHEGAATELRHVASEASRVPAVVRARAHVQLHDLRAARGPIAVDLCSVPIITELVGSPPSHARELAVQTPSDVAPPTRADLAEADDVDNSSSRTTEVGSRRIADRARSTRAYDPANVGTRTIDLAEARALVSRSQRVVALTGAGISSASGLATRKELWQRFDRDNAVSIAQFRRDPSVLWTVIRDFLADGVPTPNAAHRALARFPVITQNVEGLHQAAGSSTVLELHGTLLATRCDDCGARPSLSCLDALDDELPPTCLCGGTLRPDVVLFGEWVDPQVLSRAADHVSTCDLLLVIGTAADVAPAADLPLLAARHGATVIELKRNPSRLTRAGIAHHLAGTAEDLLPQLV